MSLPISYCICVLTEPRISATFPPSFFPFSSIQDYLFHLLHQQCFQESTAPRYDCRHPCSSCYTLFDSQRRGTFSYTKHPYLQHVVWLKLVINLLLVKQKKKMAYPHRMSVYTHIPTENVEPIPEPRGIRPLFLQEKYGASFRESIFKNNINKEKTLAGCVAAQAEHVRVCSN